MLFKNLAKDSIIYGGADFVSKSISFFIFPIVASVLSPQNFGALELILSTTLLLGYIINCGLNNSVQRFYWDSHITDQVAIVTSGFISQITFGTIAVACGLIFIPLILYFPKVNDLGIGWFTLMSALLLMTLSQWSQFILDVIRLHFRPWRFFGLVMFSRISTLFFSVIAVVSFDLGINGLLGTQFLVLLAVLPLGIFSIKKDLNFFKFSLKKAKQLINFGYPFIFTGIAFWLFSSMDRWMLAYMCSVEEVGIYSIAFRFSSVVAFLSAAFGQAWSPVAIKIRRDYPESYRTIYGQILLFITFIMLVAGGGAALFAGETINLILPGQYLSSALPLIILNFGVILQSTQHVTAIGISLENKTFLFARLAWLTAVVNFLGNCFMIPLFGAEGAATTTLISFAVLTFSQFFLTQHLHRLDIDWKRFIGLLLIACFVLVVSVNYLSFEISVYLTTAKIIFAIFCFFIGFKLIPIGSIKNYDIVKS